MKKKQITEVGLYEKYKDYFWERDSKKIECDEGWFGLINEFCGLLDNLVLQTKGLEPVFDSITQKHGLLSIKFIELKQSCFNSILWRLSYQFRERSSVVCEVCGEAGGLAYGKNNKTLCDKHMKVLDYKRKR